MSGCVDVRMSRFDDEWMWGCADLGMCECGFVNEGMTERVNG